MTKERSSTISSCSSVSGSGNGDAGGGGGGGSVVAVRKGISVYMAAFFLIAQMAGAGFLALPRALADVGWLGIPMMIVFCVSVGFTGTRLGKSWVILEERWPEVYKGRCRQPYSEIAYRALGKIGGKFTQYIVVIKLMGTTTVYVILTSELIHRIVQHATDNTCVLSQCHLILIVGAAMVPLTWLGTPKDFWQASVLAVLATVVAIIVIIVEIFTSDRFPYEPPTYPNPTVKSFSLGFGAILYAFGGSAVFPTIQNDMANRSLFWMSVIGGFAGILTLYLPVSITGYVKVGDAVESNILLMLPVNAAVLVAIAMETINIVGTYIISFNPVAQSLEQAFNLPSRFGWQRCVLRTSLVIIQIFIGLAIPNFGKILDLLGGSLITFVTFVLPPLMYMKLIDDKNPKWRERNIETWERMYLIFIMTVGIVGGILSTITATYEIIVTSFDNTCFLNFKDCPTSYE
ncbi:hypothetical protein Pcinc_036737 [Petrolisthes cinctipes]|uniref:Amino acid transporter transmembrane domain-containing protein n=1 Tax=Petrolisthes cinctipes TaxID=88211 RepID=A0AAE1BU81_PETCI|nr:hypothetical protein Pcinc_036737 [Petrolisthes cinctipes]